MKQQKKIAIYQVFPRLFGNRKSTNTPNGTIEENGVGKLSAFTSKALNTIQKIGITHIWYTGIIEHASKTDYTQYGIPCDHPGVVKGNAGSPYAIRDYYDVDPDLADVVPNRMKEFDALIERTHKAGLKAIIDFVPNHVARQYHSDAKPKGIKDLGEEDDMRTTFSANNNFYYIPGQSLELQFNAEEYEENPAKVTGNDCFSASPSVNDWYETVKLNYGVDYMNGRMIFFDPVPDTWHKMLDILLFWAGKKVDAFRCDMAEMVPVEFWAWAIPQVKAKYTEIIFIAEVYNPAEYRNYIFNGKFDYLYDKVGLYDTLRAITCGEQTTKAITGCWQALEGIQTNMLNFLENHDEQRIASSFFAQDPFKAIPAMIVAATMNVNPVMIYFGQELGEKGMDSEGFSGKDGRTTIFDYWGIKSIQAWQNDGKYTLSLLSEEQKRLRLFYTTLLRLCQKEQAIYQGIFYDLMYVNYDNPHFNPDKQYAYIRQSGKELILVVVNFDATDTKLKVNIPQHAFEYMDIDPKKYISGIDLLSEKKVRTTLCLESPVEVEVKAYSGVCIKFCRT